MDTTVFLCSEDLDSIFTAIYDAWASRLGHSHVRLEFRNIYEPELFCRYISVEPDPVKAEKVVRSIQCKISSRAWKLIYRSALAPDPGRADDIYRFLVGGFYYGASVTGMLAEPAVQRIFELNRFVGNEAHYYREFLRFDAIEDDLLLARIRPKSNVLTLLTPHFADRIPNENFLILDVDRRLVSVHPRQTDTNKSTMSTDNWYLRSLTPEQMAQLESDRPDEYRELWKTFYQSIAIEQRNNPSLQRNRMPLRYREFAPEFHGSI